MNDQPQRKKRSSRAQWLLLGTALLVLGVVVAWNLYTEHNAVDARERERLAHQASVIDENLGRQLLATNLALNSIRSDLLVHMAQKDGTAMVNQRLMAMSGAMPGVRTLIIHDASGTALASNREQLVGQNFAEREYFKLAVHGGNPAMLYISRPFKTALGVQAIAVAKVVVDRRGKFAGIIQATLDPDYFSTVLNSVLYAPDMRSAVIHGDGQLAFAVPDPGNVSGPDAAAKSGPLLFDQDKSGRAVDSPIGVIATTGDTRLTVFHTVRVAGVPVDKALVVAASRDLAAFFAPWRRNAFIQLGLFALLMLATSFGLAFYQKRKRQFDRVSARKEAEQKRQAEQYRSIIQGSLDGFWITDSRGRIVDANQASCRMLGYSHQELVQLSIADIEADESPKEIAARTREMAEIGHVKFEARHRRKDGRIINVEVSVQYIEEMVDQFFAFVRDVTEREAATAELKRSNAELEQFSYAISHDMRQPLRMISSYMQLLEASLADQLDAEQRQYFDFAIGGAKRLDQMLNGLLEYSRVGRKGEPRTWIESRGVLDEALLFLKPAITEAQARLSVAGDWPRILACRNEMLRLMLNLVGNALKFRVAGRTPEILITSQTVAIEWHFSVADNGVGIIPDQIGRLFRVFQRLHSREAYEGTGIGLALCRKIAEHHDGRIWVESAGPGQGSCFHVQLPQVSPP
jgi:PAS domain S-box-containing protein